MLEHCAPAVEGPVVGDEHVIYPVVGTVLVHATICVGAIEADEVGLDAHSKLAEHLLQVNVSRAQRLHSMVPTSGFHSDSSRAPGTWLQGMSARPGHSLQADAAKESPYQETYIDQDIKAIE